jgi:hypothetical protein
MTEGRVSRRRIALVAVGVAVAAAMALFWPRVTSGSEATYVSQPSSVRAADLEFVVPAGTAGRLVRGERVSIVPRELRVRVGDTIRIRNDDTVSQVVGPFYVRAGETLTHRFVSPGRLVGACDLHPSGKLAIVIGA